MTNRRVTFVAIAANPMALYALDDTGRIWAKGMAGVKGWLLLNSPKTMILEHGSSKSKKKGK